YHSDIYRSISQSLKCNLYPYTTLFRSGNATATADELRVVAAATTTQRLVLHKTLGTFVNSRCDRRAMKQIVGQPLRASRELCERSEEHTSELQSQSNLVCRLLLEKKIC